MRRMTSRGSLAAGALLALTSMAACDEAPEEKEAEVRFQCAIERQVDGQVIEEAVDCDDVNDGDGHVHHSGGYYPVFIYGSTYAGGPAYTPGTRLQPGPSRVRIAYKDSAGRQQFGLPPSGKVANNTVKSNVVGRGGAPIGAKGASVAGGGGAKVGAGSGSGGG